MKLNSNITIQHAQLALDLTSEILNENGPRLTGTKSCKQAGEHLKLYLDKYCDNTFSEKFQCSRDAFLYHIRYFSISYVLAFIFLCLGGHWNYAAGIITTIGCLIVLFEFVFYFEFIDPLFKKTQGYNISGIIEPEKKINQQVIISGHYDSPFVFSFLNNHQRYYKFRIALNSILYLFITGVSLWFSYIQFFSISNAQLNINILIILGIGVFFISQYFLFISWEVSPGAGDNLISSCMAVKLSELFSNNTTERSLLKHTRLVFLCPDAEESGLRGAREYVKTHVHSLKSCPTFNINMDSIYRLQDLRFLKSELNGSVSLDVDLREKCNQIAQDLGYEISSMKMPFGGGSTDAAEFAKAGIPALSIIGLDTTFSSGMVPYHTSFDTVDKIEPEA
ncbi:uncharacterized protein METZ01_LOCUS166585, partial [marine metagenome]